jgi:triosephosphate isomerase (TIM)
MTAPRPLVAGNWKMNGLKAGLTEIAAIRDAAKAGGAGRAEVAICPPFTLVAAAAEACKGSTLAIGAQDCHANVSGAHTGDISAEMLKDAGATYIIVGHSERRADHGETDAVVRAKAAAVLKTGLTAIVCVGETKDERVSGRANDVVGGQIDGSLDGDFPATNIVVAYEPVWAIGTGLTPTAADVADMHAFIRGKLEQLYGRKGVDVRILYGGSVKPSNAVELMGVKNVDGALVGGASLKCADFMGIAQVYK